MDAQGLGCDSGILATGLSYKKNNTVMNSLDHIRIFGFLLANYI